MLMHKHLVKVIKQNVNPKVIGGEFLTHEFIKLFSNKTADFYNEITSSVNDWINNFNDEDFWRLVSALSEDWKLKGLDRVLTDSSYIWNLEKVPLERITFTGMSPKLDELFKEANWQPGEFQKIWDKHPELHNTSEGIGLREHNLTNNFPVILYEENNKLKVIDGMRRTCVAILNNKIFLKAWVGRLTNPEGQMLIAPDKVLYTMHLYEEFGKHDEELLKAIEKILIFYKQHFRNGKQVVDKFVSAWLTDNKLKPVAENIMKQN